MSERLFTPLIMGKAKLPNRICFLAHRTNLAKAGRLSDRHMEYYRRRARGGCGLIMVGELSIHPDNRPWESMIDAYDPKVVNDYQRLTGAVHQEDTLVFAHLNHHGFQSSGAITRKAVWGPSALSDIAFGEVSKAMELEEIEEVVAAFSRSAGFALEGGFDGVEIDMGPESLLRQFLSPLSNHRQDVYGGNLENRMRFPLAVLKGIRKVVGRDYTVGVRLCVDEKFWGAITLDESRIFAQRFADEGQVDFVNVTLGTYYNLHLILASMHTPAGFTVELAEEMKRVVKVPVIASYQISTARMANEIVAQGQADAVGYVRQLICDPDFPNKMRQGRTADIRFCVRDNKGCIGRINQNKVIGCIQNPEVGCESLSRDEGPSQVMKKKRVIVVGGGPAGLEAARTAKWRGHEVTLFEKDKEVGGQINLIRKRPGREGMEGVIRYLTHSLKSLRVPIISSFDVTPEWLLEQDPDVVILATGSSPIERPVAGKYGPPSVLNVREVLREEHPVGERVLFVDENGGHHAAATVEYLADRGKKLTMVTSDLFVGIELAPLGDLYLTRQRLLQKGVIFAPDVVIDEIQGKLVKGRDIYTNKPLLFDGYDTVVLDMGNSADDGLYRKVKGRIREVYRVGDCVAPRGIDMAVLEGRRIGESL